MNKVLNSVGLVAANVHLRPEITVLNDPIALFLLSYIYNLTDIDNVPVNEVTHRDLSIDLGWNIRDIIARCYDLSVLGMLKMEYVPEEVTGAVSLSERAKKMLRRLGLDKIVEPSGISPAMARRFLDAQESGILSGSNSLTRKLSVISNAKQLFLLSYIYNTAGAEQIAYADLSQDLGWEFNEVAEICRSLDESGFLRGSRFKESSLTSEGMKLLSRAGFAEREELSIASCRRPLDEVDEPGMTIAPLIELNGHFKEDIAIFEVIVNLGGRRITPFDLLRPSSELLSSREPKVVLDLARVTNLSEENMDVIHRLIHFLWQLAAYVASHRGRLVLASVPPLVADHIVHNEGLSGMNIYESQAEAIEALDQPPFNESLHRGSSA
jgi:hypothetical protein